MLYSTSEKLSVDNYPYGYKKTTMFFSVEFSPSKGFRTVRQTINPKNGRLNAPKKSTYGMVFIPQMVDGFADFKCVDFYHVEKFVDQCHFLSDNFDLFTIDQKKYIYGRAYQFLRVEAQAICTYCGANPDEVLPILEPATKLAVAGFKDPSQNLLGQITLDVDLLNSKKVEGYQPFKVTSTSVIDFNHGTVTAI